MSRRRRPASKRPAEHAFWGRRGEPSLPPEPIRPTTDPGAVPRSLGDPPLTASASAQHRLAIVYEEAVRAATALAAANGLLDPGVLDGDDDG